TEITLNTSKDETAVCNLGSINLSQVMSAPNPLERLREVIRLAIRNLDSVIDVNYYPSDRASNSNFKHRPIGLGVMGYYEWLVKQGVDFESEEHLKQADALFEAISYFAIEASADLAQERGSYPSFEGSNWSKGILPIDNAKLMEDGKPFFDQPRRFD
ncbi:ribonucleoside-diphosphate reductase subunit alpha, partial [Acinetobacter baumannii]